MRSIFRASLLVLPGLLLASLFQESVSENVTQPAFTPEFYYLVKTVILPMILVNKAQQKLIYDRVVDEEILDRIKPEYLTRNLTNAEIQRATLLDILYHPRLVKQIIDLYAVYYIEAIDSFDLGLYEPILEEGPDVEGFIPTDVSSFTAKPTKSGNANSTTSKPGDTTSTTSKPGSTSSTASRPKEGRQLSESENQNQKNVYYDAQQRQWPLLANNNNNEPFPILSRILNRVQPLAPLGLRPAQPLLGRNFAASFSVASGAPRPLFSQDQQLRGQKEKTDGQISQSNQNTTPENDGQKTKRESKASHEYDSSSTRRKSSSDNRKHRHSRRHAPRQTRWSLNDNFRGNFDRSVNGKYVGYVLDGSTPEETRYMRLDPHQRWDNPYRNPNRKIVIDPPTGGRTYLYEPSVYEVDETPNGLHVYPRYGNLPGAQLVTPYTRESGGNREPDAKPTTEAINKDAQDSKPAPTSFPTVYYAACRPGDKNCFYAIDEDNQDRHDEEESSYEKDITDTDHDESSNDTKAKGGSETEEKLQNTPGQHPAAARTRSYASNTSNGVSASSEAYVSSGNVPQTSPLSGIAPQLFEPQRTPILAAVGRNVRGRLRDLITRTAPVVYQPQMVA